MYNRLKQICKEKGTTITKLCEQATGNSGNLATWAKGRMNTDHLINCAKILNVSADYILGIQESSGSLPQIPNINGFSKQELELIAVYRELGIEKQAELIACLFKLKNDST